MVKIDLVRRARQVFRTTAVCVVFGIVGACQPPPEPPPVIGTVPAFALVDHLSRPVTADHLRGQPWVADFIFTRCTMICPRMTERMKVLERAYRDRAVRFVSVSVDPEHDTVDVLSAYAERVQAGDAWLFLTGDREAIRALSIDGMKLALMPAEGEDLPPGEAIVHSNRFVLVDAEGQIRGYYDGFDREAFARLETDLDALLE